MAGNKAIKQYFDTITQCFSCISGIIYFVLVPWVGVTQCRVVTVGSQTFRIKQRSLCKICRLPTITPNRNLSQWRLGSFSKISDHDFLSLQKYFLCFTISPLYLYVHKNIVNEKLTWTRIETAPQPCDHVTHTLLFLHVGEVFKREGPHRRSPEGVGLHDGLQTSSDKENMTDTVLQNATRNACWPDDRNTQRQFSGSWLHHYLHPCLI